MQYLKTYLQKIIDRGNPLLADSIKNTAEDVGNQYIKTFSYSEAMESLVQAAMRRCHLLMR